MIRHALRDHADIIVDPNQKCATRTTHSELLWIEQSHLGNCWFVTQRPKGSCGRMQDECFCGGGRKSSCTHSQGCARETIVCAQDNSGYSPLAASARFPREPEGFLLVRYSAHPRQTLQSLHRPTPFLCVRGRRTPRPPSLNSNSPRLALLLESRRTTGAGTGSRTEGASLSPRGLCAG